MNRVTAVVVVTHGKAGADMIDAAEAFLRVPIPLLAAVGVDPGDDRAMVDAKIDIAVRNLAGLNSCDVLFLVDLVGSTPARLCCGKCGADGHVVTGVNMPMLVKLAKDREERSLPDAIAMAQEAGRKYVTIASRVLAGK